jgi:hypothetical protein
MLTGFQYKALSDVLQDDVGALVARRPLIDLVPQTCADLKISISLGYQPSQLIGWQKAPRLVDLKSLIALNYGISARAGTWLGYAFCVYLVLVA